MRRNVCIRNSLKVNNNNKFKLAVIKYAIATAVAGVISLLLMNSFGVFSGTLPIDQIFRYMSDAFFVPGALLVLFGAMVFISTTGFFDSIGYIGAVAIRALVPGMRLNRGEKFVDYKERKSESRITGYSFIFFVGLAFLLLGVLFTVLFFTV